MQTPLTWGRTGLYDNAARHSARKPDIRGDCCREAVYAILNWGNAKKIGAIIVYRGGKIGLFYKMDLERVGKGWYEVGPIRPPSEGKDHSLLLRVTRNCPWNQCEFCRTYKKQKYGARAVEEVKADIDTVKALAEEIKSASWQIGMGGNVNSEVITAMIKSNPELYGENDEELVNRRLNCLFSVANWLYSGGANVFLQDANTPQMHTPELLEILFYLKEKFPGIERITSYARSKTIARKTDEQMRQLKEAGLKRLHIGMESGLDEVLEDVKKGVTAEEQIIAGKKTKAAGITLSEYIMPGLGGRKWSERHAVESARVLNEIDADFIRLRSFTPRRNSPMYEKVLAGQFSALNEDEVVAEIGLFVKNLNCSSYLISDQMVNLLWEIEGRLPRDKEAILKKIDNYLQKPEHERLRICLDRRLSAYVSISGFLDHGLSAKVDEARRLIDQKAPEAGQKVREILDIIKPLFI